MAEKDFGPGNFAWFLGVEDALNELQELLAAITEAAGTEGTHSALFNAVDRRVDVLWRAVFAHQPDIAERRHAL
jgi:hypothetical protein